MALSRRICAVYSSARWMTLSAPNMSSCKIFSSRIVATPCWMSSGGRTYFIITGTSFTVVAPSS
eukprot:jgi/Mesvir1/6919/Mv26513-RA.1